MLLLVVFASACAGTDQPDALRAGRSIYGDTCSVCHGDRGAGGIGPSLEFVIETWPDCDDHVEWVAIGSEGWSARHGDTHGATQKPTLGGMPAHEGRLAPEEIRRVAAFERVEYGGLDEDTAIVECGVDAG